MKNECTESLDEKKGEKNIDRFIFHVVELTSFLFALRLELSTGGSFSRQVENSCANAYGSIVNFNCVNRTREERREKKVNSRKFAARYVCRLASEV